MLRYWLGLRTDDELLVVDRCSPYYWRVCTLSAVPMLKGALACVCCSRKSFLKKAIFN